MFYQPDMQNSVKKDVFFFCCCFAFSPRSMGKVTLGNFFRPHFCVPLQSFYGFYKGCILASKYDSVFYGTFGNPRVNVISAKLHLQKPDKWWWIVTYSVMARVRRTIVREQKVVQGKVKLMRRNAKLQSKNIKQCDPFQAPYKPLLCCLPK